MYLHRAKTGYCTVNVRHGLVIFLDLLQKNSTFRFPKRNQNMKKLLYILPLFLGGFFWSQNFKQDSLQFKKISDEILVNGKSYEDLRELTKDIGNRLSGSSNYEKSADWAMKKMLEAGADQVWFQPVMVNVWTRGDESLKLRVNHGKWKEVKMLSLGNSEGTKGKDLEGEVILVKTLEDFEKLPDYAVKDKIVFFNYAFKQEFVVTGQAYGDAGKYRRVTPSEVAKKGGKAVIIRSLTSSFDDVPHTGSTRYEDGIPKIPAIAIGAESADYLEEILLKKQKVQAVLNSNCGMNGQMMTKSVIGEIKGKSDEKVIVVGAHLDSWDVGEGAHDDGAGIVQSIEVLRTFKNLKLKNNHTIRVVCFANEENGVRGGRTYMETVKKSEEPHIFALESDSGGFTPRSFSLGMHPDKAKSMKSWEKLFNPYGIYEFAGDHSGVDIEPLRELKIPASGLVTDSQRYFDIHHTPEDTFEKVNRRELLLGAVVMTQLIYMVDKNW